MFNGMSGRFIVLKKLRLKEAVLKCSEAYIVRYDLILALVTLHNGHVPRVDTLPRVALVLAFID